MSANESETRARAMGWLPKEEFTGNESSWVDAEKYLERGEQFMPLLRANNKKLTTELYETRAQLKAATEAIEELKNFRSTLNLEKVQEQKKEVLAGIKAAKEAGDVDAEVQLTDKLSEVNGALKEAAKPKPAAAVETTPQLTPEGKAWLEANPWFGKDNRKTALAQGISADWKAMGRPVGTQEYFDYVDSELAAVFDQNAARRQRASKVDGTTNGASGTVSGSKTFADLPPEAKAACERAAERLVGPNRAYKTKAEWQAKYVKLYDWS